MIRIIIFLIDLPGQCAQVAVFLRWCEMTRKLVLVWNDDISSVWHLVWKLSDKMWYGIFVYMCSCFPSFLCMLTTSDYLILIGYSHVITCLRNQTLGEKNVLNLPERLSPADGSRGVGDLWWLTPPSSYSKPGVSRKFSSIKFGGYVINMFFFFVETPIPPNMVVSRNRSWPIPISLQCGAPYIVISWSGFAPITSSL